jgi:hypothetical protein
MTLRSVHTRPVSLLEQRPDQSAAGAQSTFGCSDDGSGESRDESSVSA